MVGYSESIIRFCFLSFCKCNYIIDGKNEYIYMFLLILIRWLMNKYHKNCDLVRLSVNIYNFFYETQEKNSSYTLNVAATYLIKVIDIINLGAPFHTMTHI